MVNINDIKLYQSRLNLKDYDGNNIEINLDKSYPSVSAIAGAFFNKSKKAKQKLNHLHIEKQSLSSKIKHIEHFIYSVQNAETMSKINLLFPKQNKVKQKKQNDSIEIFYIEGYKIQLGKNEKGNIAILKKAKARDIWLHMRDRPSAHVIITTDKQNVPIEVIKNAARLCVDFTMFSKDRYLVDYTQRREVSIQDGANVF